MNAPTKKTVLATTLALGLLCGSVIPVLAEEEKPSADLTVAAYSQYIWRGFAFSDDSVVIQPSMTVGYKGFGVNLWGNLDSDPVAGGGESWNETDLTLSYDGSMGMVGYSLGYIYYGLDGMDDSQELYAGLSLDTLLAPTLTVYKEITGLGGWYATLGVSHSFPISEKVGLDLGATVSYYDDENDYDEFHSGLLSAALPIAVNDFITVAPELYYSFPLTSDSEDYLEAANLGLIGQDDAAFVYGGVSVSFSF